MSDVTWGPKITDRLNLKVRCSIDSIIPPSDIGFVLSNDPTEALRIVHGEARIGSKDTLYMINAEQRVGLTTIKLSSPHKGFRFKHIY